MYLSEDPPRSHPLLFLLFVGVGLLVAIIVAVLNPKKGFWATFTGTFIEAALMSWGLYMFSAALSGVAFGFGMIALGAVGMLVDTLIPDSALLSSLMAGFGLFGIFGVPLVIIMCQLAFVAVYVWKKSR